MNKIYNNGVSNSAGYSPIVNSSGTVVYNDIYNNISDGPTGISQIGFGSLSPNLINFNNIYKSVTKIRL